MGVAKAIVVGTKLRDECILAIVTEEAGGHGHGAACVEHVNYGLGVVRRDLDGGVRMAGGCAADEQRQRKALALHFAGHMHHLVERGRDQAAEADEVGFFGLGTLENFLAGDHHAHVDDLVVIAGQHHADDVFADVVDIAFDGGEHDFSLRLDHLAAATIAAFRLP